MAQVWVGDAGLGSALQLSDVLLHWHLVSLNWQLSLAGQAGKGHVLLAHGKCLCCLLHFAVSLGFVRLGAARCMTAGEGVSWCIAGCPATSCSLRAGEVGGEAEQDAVTAAARELGARQGFGCWLQGCTVLEGLPGAARPWLSAATCCWWPETAPKCCSVLRQESLCTSIHNAATALGACSSFPLQPPVPLCCSVLSGAQDQAEEGMFWLQLKVAKLLLQQIHEDTSCLPSCAYLLPAQGSQRGSAPAVPSREKLSVRFHSVPWDTFLYPFEVERVSLVNRQADDFRGFKGMDGSEVETDAEEQCHRQPGSRADPLLLAAPEAEVPAPSLPHALC